MRLRRVSRTQVQAVLLSKRIADQPSTCLHCQWQPASHIALVGKSDCSGRSDCLTLPSFTASKHSVHLKSTSMWPARHFGCSSSYVRGISTGMLGLHASCSRVCCGSHSHVQSYRSFWSNHVELAGFGGHSSQCEQLSGRCGYVHPGSHLVEHNSHNSVTLLSCQGSLHASSQGVSRVSHRCNSGCASTPQLVQLSSAVDEHLTSVRCPGQPEQGTHAASRVGEPARRYCPGTQRGVL